MKTFCARRTRAAGLRWWILGSAALALVLSAAGVLPAQDIIRVEEDWQFVVDSPDTLTVSPQATTTMAPVGNLNSLYAVFDLNLRNFPSYEAGGVQLQLWNGESAVTSVRSNTGVVLQSNGETITWTQRMELADGDLSFSVVNGQSSTWGRFGQDSPVSVSTSSDLQNLNSYTPTLTLGNSGVGFGANRVQSLSLVGIRVYSTAGLVAQDTSEHVVYVHP